MSECCIIKKATQKKCENLDFHSNLKRLREAVKDTMIIPTAVKPLPNYCLWLKFSTGEEKIFDVSPYLSMPFFSPLKDVAAFKQIFIGEYTVEWANGRDIAPDELYSGSISIDETSDFIDLNPKDK